ncbi:hypothetical protein ACC718_17980 [Rhizobium ruizarguesonis]
MRLQEVRNNLQAAISSHEKAISNHLVSVLAKGRTTGTEGIFTSALNHELTRKGTQFEPEAPIEEVGVQQFYKGRKTGRVDIFMPDRGTAFECKAVQMPRSKSSPKFDLGQLLADYMRLRSGRTLNFAYLVIFVYGNIVAQASSPGSLYRRFHNQMFVDQDLAKQAGSLSCDEIKAANELEWTRAWGSSQPPAYAAAVKVNNLGAICISVF